MNVLLGCLILTHLSLFISAQLCGFIYIRYIPVEHFPIDNDLYHYGIVSYGGHFMCVCLQQNMHFEHTCTCILWCTAERAPVAVHSKCNLFSMAVLVEAQYGADESSCWFRLSITLFCLSVCGLCLYIVGVLTHVWRSEVSIGCHRFSTLF